MVEWTQSGRYSRGGIRGLFFGLCTIPEKYNVTTAAEFIQVVCTLCLHCIEMMFLGDQIIIFLPGSERERERVGNCIEMLREGVCAKECSHFLGGEGGDLLI